MIMDFLILDIFADQFDLELEFCLRIITAGIACNLLGDRQRTRLHGIGKERYIVVFANLFVFSCFFVQFIVSNDRIE